jgi:hypothetical protein
MDTAPTGHDNLSTLVTRASDGQREARVIGSIVRYLYATGNSSEVFHVLADERTRIVSVTVTGDGYDLDAGSGQFHADNPTWCTIRPGWPESRKYSLPGCARCVLGAEWGPAIRRAGPGRLRTPLRL